jgi:phage FluMu protein Com
MPSDAEKLLGKIAVEKRFLSPEQLDSCVKIQEGLAISRPLGSIFLENKLLSQKQLDELVKLQKERMTQVDPATKRREQAKIFGQQVVKLKLATLERVNECLRLQAQDTTGKTLGEVMVAKGYLKPEDVRKALASQQKKTMRCPACNLSYTVATTTDATKVKCPKCKGLLVEQKKTETVKTDAEFGTMIASALDLQLNRPKPVTATTTMINAKCVICDNEFTGALDSTQRIRCPKCQSIFTPRRR